MAKEIDGKDLIVFGKGIHLLFPDPHSSTVAVDQHEGFARSFYDITEAVGFTLKGLKRKGRIPVHPVGPHQRKASF
jgi:hypothetical protein